MAVWAVKLRVVDPNAEFPHPSKIIAGMLPDMAPDFRVEDGVTMVIFRVDEQTAIKAEWHVVGRLEDEHMFGIARLINAVPAHRNLRQ